MTLERLRGAREHWLIALLVLSIAFGVWLRFDNLAGKVLYEDEAATALHATGHLDLADLRPLFDGSVRTAGDIARLERYTPDRGLRAAVTAVAREDSDQGVAFYVLEHTTLAALGSTIPMYRFVSAFFGVLTIAAAWLLAAELFQSWRVGLVYAAVVALSPFEVLYSHEARSYTMAACLVLLASYALLRLLKRPSVATWLLYAAFLSLGLYSSILIFLVLGAHALYVLWFFRQHWRTAVAFLTSAACGVASFVPWAAVMASNHNLVSAELTWGSTPYGLKAMLAKWLFNANAQFFDLEWLDLKFGIAGALILLLALVALVYLVRTTPSKQWSFVVLLGGLSAVFFIGRDVVTHAHWSTTARYLLTTWLAMQLAVAYTVSSWALSMTPARRLGAAGAAVLITLLCCEGVSAFVGTRASSWYDDELSAPTPHIAAAINAAKRPTLVLGEKSWGFFLDLSNYLDPDTHLELFRDVRRARLRTTGYAQVFATTPSASLRDSLKQDGYRLQLVYRFVSVSQAYTNFHKNVAVRAQAGNDGTPSFPNALYRVLRGPTEGRI